ncbi:MAG TPA: hypothetical protein ENJ95_09575 [Bacteroidetes bacterium]|nr:hypothetical protein [Bacteroidota bacterium]
MKKINITLIGLLCLLLTGWQDTTAQDIIHGANAMETIVAGAAARNYYDDGGAECDEDPSGGPSDGGYSLDADLTTTFCPDVAGQPVTIEFLEVDIETRLTQPCWDYIRIYDGQSTAAPELFAGCGEDGFPNCAGEPGDEGDGFQIEGGVNDMNGSNSANPANNIFTSTDPSGCITVNFQSDGSIDEGGWTALVSAPAVNTGNCGLNFPIPDDTCPDNVVYDIDVDTAPGLALGGDVILTDVNIIVEHTWVSDLQIQLASPSGVVIDLTLGNGDEGENYGDPNDPTCSAVTNFTMSAADNIFFSEAPFIGSFLPEGDFADFFDGTNPNGTWQLIICDNAFGDVGTLEFVELIFEGEGQFIPSISLRDFDGDGFPDITDPCSCTDPDNVALGSGEVTYFHDFVTITSAPGETWELTALNSGAVLDAALAPLPIGTTLPEVSPGVYRIDLWHPSNVGFDADFNRAGSPLATPLNTGGVCDGTACVAGAVVPTMGQWATILFALIMLSFGVVFVMRQQVAVAGMGNAASSFSSGIPFDKSIFGKILAYVMLGLALVFAVAISAFGYEMTNADVPGSLLAGPALAYLIHLVAMAKKK